MRKVVCKSGEKKGLYNDVFRYVCLYGYEFGACLSLVSQNTAFGLMCWMFCKSIQLFCMGGKTRIRDIFKLDKFLAMYNTYEKALHHLSHGGCGYVCMYVCISIYVCMYVHMYETPLIHRCYLISLLYLEASLYTLLFLQKRYSIPGWNLLFPSSSWKKGYSSIR